MHPAGSNSCRRRFKKATSRHLEDGSNGTFLEPTLSFFGEPLSYQDEKRDRRIVTP